MTEIFLLGSLSGVAWSLESMIDQELHFYIWERNAHYCVQSSLFTYVSKPFWNPGCESHESRVLILLPWLLLNSNNAVFDYWIQVIEMPEHHPGQLGGTMRLGKRRTIFRENQPSVLSEFSFRRCSTSSRFHNCFFHCIVSKLRHVLPGLSSSVSLSAWLFDLHLWFFVVPLWSF